MSMQKGPWEKDNLKLHFCNSQFEAYSASYLTTKQHMLAGMVLILVLVVKCIFMSIVYCIEEHQHTVQFKAHFWKSLTFILLFFFVSSLRSCE